MPRSRAQHSLKSLLLLTSLSKGAGALTLLHKPSKITNIPNSEPFEALQLNPPTSKQGDTGGVHIIEWVPLLRVLPRVPYGYYTKIGVERPQQLGSDSGCDSNILIQRNSKSYFFASIQATLLSDYKFTFSLSFWDSTNLTRIRGLRAL